MVDFFYPLLGLCTCALVPAAIGYALQMLRLKKGATSPGKAKLRWIILPSLGICALSAAGMRLFPLLEDDFAGIYLLAFMSAYYTSALALGQWAARSDFRRK